MRMRVAVTKPAVVAGDSWVVACVQWESIGEAEGATEIGSDVPLSSDASIDAINRDAVVIQVFSSLRSWLKSVAVATRNPWRGFFSPGSTLWC